MDLLHVGRRLINVPTDVLTTTPPYNLYGRNVLPCLSIDLLFVCSRIIITPFICSISMIMSPYITIDIYHAWSGVANLYYYSLYYCITSVLFLQSPSMSTDPTQLPLWYAGSRTNLYMEEGVAMRSGGRGTERLRELTHTHTHKHTHTNTHTHTHPPYQ